MEKSQIIAGIKYIKDNSKKRNFDQSIDLIINLKDLDIKNQEHNVNSYINLHYSKGKDSKICALVGPELFEQAKEVCDKAVLIDEFKSYQDKKKSKKLASEYDFFIAQATIMPQVATSFGRVFGPRGKMPNPKAGCVVPPNANLKQLYKKLQNTVHLQTRNEMILKCAVGNEKSKDEDIIDNVQTVYNTALNVLPNDKNNIKSVLLKLTMGKPVRIDSTVSSEISDIKSPKDKKSEKKDDKNPPIDQKEMQVKEEKSSDDDKANNTKDKSKKPKKIDK